jgi:predicted transcriptional regulator YdeE
MLSQKPELFQCEVVEQGYQFIGQTITANFPGGFPDAAVKVQRQFELRKHEIIGAKNTEIICCPYMCNGIFATYFACLEVDDLSLIPEGMIGFQLPAMKYAKITCTNRCIGEAYGKVFEWIKKHEYKQKFLDQSCPIEIFYYEEDAEAEEMVEILIPIL